MANLLDTIPEVAIWDDRAAAWDAVKDCTDCLVFQRNFADPARERYRAVMNHGVQLQCWQWLIDREAISKAGCEPDEVRIHMLEIAKRKAKRFLEKQEAEKL